MPTVTAFLILLSFQLAGESIARFAHLPIPGPVLGMLLLAGWYLLRRREPSEAVQRASDGLLNVLGLLFVPAGVGIISSLGVLRVAWLPIAVSLVGSTLLTLVVTAWIMNRAAHRRKEVC